VTNYALKFAALLSADAVPSMETVEEEPVEEENPMEEDHTEEVLISDQEEPAAHEVPVKDREEFFWDNLLKDFRRESKYSYQSTKLAEFGQFLIITFLSLDMRPTNNYVELAREQSTQDRLELQRLCHTPTPKTQTKAPNYALKFAALLSEDAGPSKIETTEEEMEEEPISDQEETVRVKEQEELCDDLLKDFDRSDRSEEFEYDEWTDEEEDGWSDEEEEDLQEPASHEEPASAEEAPLFVQEEEPAQHEAIDEEEEEAFNASLESLHIHEEEEEKDAVNEHYRDIYRSWLKRRSICDEQQIDLSASESQLLGSGNCDHYYRNQEQGRRYSSCDDFAASDSKLLPGPHSYQEQDFTEAARKTSAFRKGLKVLGKFKPMKYIGRRTVIQNKCPIDCPDIMGTESPKTVMASSLLSSNYDASLTSLFDDEDIIFES
jgi:hypothetical protein